MSGGFRPTLAVIASWPKPNYVDPITQGPALVYVGVILTVVASCLVAARIWSRFFITRAPGIDDVFIVVSLACGIGITALILDSNYNLGIGRHVWDVPLSSFPSIRKNAWIAAWCYVTAIGCVKISILLFYRRLAGQMPRIFFIATWIGIVYNVLYCTTAWMVLALQCRPSSAYWASFSTAWLEAGHTYTCADEQAILPASAIMSVIGDFYTTMLPLLLIRYLEIPKNRKIVLYPLFTLGFFVVAAGITRTYYIWYLSRDTWDSTWNLWNFYIWTFVELYLAIIVASAPALKPFFRRFIVDRILSHRQSYTYGPDSDQTAPSFKRWSGPGSAGRRSDYADVEKIGVAVGGEDPGSYELTVTEHGEDSGSYELTVTEHGKVERVLQRPTSGDRFSGTTRTSAAIDPISASTEDEYPLKTYPVRVSPIEADSGNQLDSVIPSGRFSFLAAAGCPSSPNGPGSPDATLDDDPPRPRSQGSVKAARLRAQKKLKDDSVQQRTAIVTAFSSNAKRSSNSSSLLADEDKRLAQSMQTQDTALGRISMASLKRPVSLVLNVEDRHIAEQMRNRDSALGRICKAALTGTDEDDGDGDRRETG